MQWNAVLACALVVSGACFTASSPAAAQQVTAAAPAAPSGRLRPPRIYTTVRLAGPAPAIDGRLDDEAWRQGEWSGDYTQQLPNEGAKPSHPTEIKILYDDEHVYVAIRAYDDMSKIHRYPARRDEFAGDILGVCFDSYFDKRTGFEFDLNAAGSKLDLVLTNEGWDTSWDAVWDGKVGYEPNAWTAEFKIPLSQLRYGTQDEQVWGLHAWRWHARNQEESQWNLIPRNSTGRMYNLGELHGIRGLPRSRRIELLPHTVGRVEAAPREAGNPYRSGPDGVGAAGIDIKAGLTSDFTLDGTVNPDFGQVEADPSVVNLTTYETFFEEKRPFFVEGKNIFTFLLEPTAVAGDANVSSGDMLFYSRRIGQPPTYTPPVAEGESVDMPGRTSILSAAKISGKTADGLSVAVLHSLTGAERASISTAEGPERRPLVEPASQFLVARLQKDWDKGNTILGGMLTSTHRWTDDPALSFMPGDAFTGGLDFVQFFRNRSYVVEAKGTFSRITGEPDAIVALQTDPVHNFQRPDATHLDVDAGASSLAGHGGSVRVARYGNSKWRYGDSLRWVSPGLELNDAGYLRQADLLHNEASVGYEQTDPQGPFRSYSLGLEREDAWDFGGLKTDGETEFEASGTFANKWRMGTEVRLFEAPVDTRLLRGGPAMTLSPSWGAEVFAGTDNSRRIVVSTGIGHHQARDGGTEVTSGFGGLSVRVTRGFTASGRLAYEQNTNDLQYVDTVISTVPRYVLGRIDQDTLSLTLRADVILTPELSVQYYGSPFVSNGRYGQFKRATETRASEYADRFHAYGPGEITYRADTNTYEVTEGDEPYAFANPDFSFREFRSNLVGRWEFRPGSTLYAVWSQGRTSVASPWDGTLGDSLDALRRTEPTNVFLLKISYWFSL